jgi:hypothetical protein
VFIISRNLRHLMLAASLLSTFLLPLPWALAQPDTIQRNFVPPAPEPEPSLLSLAQLQTITGGPTLVTFAGQDKVADIAKALLNAAHMPIPTSPTLPPNVEAQTITVDWKQVPFWTAAQQVESLTGLSWSAPYMGGGLWLRLPVGAGSANLNGRIAAEAPFFKIVANSISRSATTQLRDPGAKVQNENLLPASSDSTRLLLSVYSDPKLQVESRVVRAVQVQTADGAVTNAKPFLMSPAFSVLVPTYSHASTLNVVLPTGLRSGTTISRLSGILHTTLILSSKKWQIPDLNAITKETQTAGPAQYSIDNFRVQADQLRLRVTVVRPRSPLPIRSYDSNQFFTNLHLRDAQGNDLISSIVSTRTETVNNQTQIQKEFSFQAKTTDGKKSVGPFSLEWPLALEKGSFDVPFEMRDVVVP